MVEQAQLPVVDRDHAQYPGGGHTRLGQDHLYPEKHFRILFKAAVAGRLHNAEEARLLHRGDRGFGQVAEACGFHGACAQCGQQIAGGFV